MGALIRTNMAEHSTFFEVLHKGTASVQGYHRGHEKGSLTVRYRTEISFASGSHCIWSRYTDFHRLHKNLKHPSDRKCAVCCRLSKVCNSIQLPRRNPLSLRSPRQLAEERLPVFHALVSKIVKAFATLSCEDLETCESHGGAGATLRQFWHLSDVVEKAMASNDEFRGTIEYIKESKMNRPPETSIPEDLTTKLHFEVTDYYVPQNSGWRPVTVEYFRLGEQEENAGRLKIVRNGHALTT